jgi:hypothetical protein
LSFRTFSAGQQSKLTKKFENSALNSFLVVTEPEEQKFSLKKLKFQQIVESGWCLHGIFSSFQIFLAGQQSKLTKKFENSALNMFLKVAEIFQETCLVLVFRILSLVFIVGQPSWDQDQQFEHPRPM